MGRGLSTEPTGSTPRASARWAALAVVTGLLVAVPAAPSFAATSTVTTFAGLQAALGDCGSAPNTIVLGADISQPETGITAECDTTLDLSTHDLSVLNVQLGTGVEFTVTGPTDGSGGTLTADASDSSQAGISTSEATLTVRGGRVNAYGGSFSAGIGGTLSGQLASPDAGTLNVEGGTVDAYGGVQAAAVGGASGGGSGGTVTVTSGALNAFGFRYDSVGVGGGGGGGDGADVTVTGGILTASAGGIYGTAIGGGVALASSDGGSGGSLTIGAGAEVVAMAERNAFGAGWKGTPTGDFGSLRVDGTLRLPSGRLYVGRSTRTSTEVRVGATGRIVGSVADPAAGATLEGPGWIDNQGSITLSSRPPAGMVTGNNTLVHFDSPTATDVQVLAPSFADGARILPTAPAGTAWNTAADGSGSWFTSTSPLGSVGFLNLYAVAPATMTVPTDFTIAAGENVYLPITVKGPDGAPLSPQPGIEFTFAGCSLADGGVFTVAGPCTVTASTTVQGTLIQKTFTIRIVPGPLTSLGIRPAPVTVTQGSSVAFMVDAADRYGNAIDTSAAVLTSDREADVLNGHTVAFSGAGSHTITATFQGYTVGSRVTVVAGPISSLSITPTNATVIQGDTITFTVDGTDAGGNPVDTSSAVLTSGGRDTVGGHTILFSGAGDRTVTATLDGVTASASVRVVAGPLAALSLSPSTATVVEGGTTAFTLTGTDAAGNPVNVDGAILTAAPTDTIEGRTIRFSGAGVRTVTATLNGITTTAEITVIAGPLHTLTITPRSTTATQGDTITFTVDGTDTAGNPVDTSGAMLASETRSDRVDGRSVTFSGAGTHVVTATLDGVSTSASIDVVAGPLASLSLTPATATVMQGSTTVFTITGADAAGNPVNADTATLSSTARTDVVDGRAVTFSGAGIRTIAATLDGVEATATVDVVAGPVAALTLTPSSATVTQGDTLGFTVTAADSAGNPIDTTGAVLSSDNRADTISGTSVAFSGAGAHTITATLDGVTAAASITVTAGPAATLAITPSATSVDQGGTLTFAVTGADAAGNPVDTGTAVLTSSVDTDVIAGTAVTFPHASPHTITATLGGLTATVTIEVIPAVAPSPAPTAPSSPAASAAGLADTGLDSGTVGAAGAAALALLLAGAALLLPRRTRIGRATHQPPRP
ncbi:beta strand repeat-containing protein [Cnuibacter sp. UC19_7]|uniref:beta strand repeat-containing protein n=1 Tax=Cnuibacter sp. UC19_7 TaxID=3350166 RepID=UPI00366FDE30